MELKEAQHEHDQYHLDEQMHPDFEERMDGIYYQEEVIADMSVTQILSTEI